MNKYKVKLLVRPIVEAENEEQAMELAAEELRLRLNEARRKNEPLKIYFDTAWPEPVESWIG
jgi:hypothetical protein